MVDVGVGDRVRLITTRGRSREGFVTGVAGALVRIRWASGVETTVVPAAGTLTVLPEPVRPVATGAVDAQTAETNAVVPRAKKDRNEPNAKHAKKKGKKKAKRE